MCQGANLHKSATLFQEAQRLGDVVIMAETVQHHLQQERHVWSSAYIREDVFFQRLATTKGVSQELLGPKNCHL